MADYAQSTSTIIIITRESMAGETDRRTDRLMTHKQTDRQTDKTKQNKQTCNNQRGWRVSNLAVYAQSTSTVIIITRASMAGEIDRLTGGQTD